MVRKLREKTRGKKGFTLVELIVVIVIILILAAVLVPQLLRYVDRANEAKVRADAATILSQVQADFALFKVDNSDITKFPPSGYKVNGVTVFRDAWSANPGTARVSFQTNAQGEDTISKFDYNSGTYTVNWENLSPELVGVIDPWTVRKNQK